MPAKNPKRNIAAVAAIAVVGLGAAAAVTAFAAAPAGAARPQSPHVTRLMSPQGDPRLSTRDGDATFVLCATAIEYGLISAG